MISFEPAFNETFKNEGIHSLDPNDNGKETVYGISRVHHPQWEGWKIVDEIKKTEGIKGLSDKIRKDVRVLNLAIIFYKETFWGTYMKNIPTQKIANELFDTAVNQGKENSIIYLQKALNVLNRNGQDYADIKPDGIFGDNTLNAINGYYHTQRFRTRDKEKLEKWLLKWMNYFQMKTYESIINKDSKQEKFVPGWTERS